MRRVRPPRSGLPRWLGYFGLLTAGAGLVGVFRNVTDVVDPVAGVNNYLLPLWMIAFGIGLLRIRGSDSAPRVPRPVAEMPAPADRSDRSN